MNFMKRASLYLVRKKGRTILLFLYMFGMACFIFMSVFFLDGAEQELDRLRRTYGTGFVLDLDGGNEAYLTTAEFNGQVSKVYTGPIITDELINAIMKIPGVVDYTLSNEYYPVWTGLNLKPGAWTEDYPPDIISLEELKIKRQEILMYPCRNGERHKNFSTGAFEISKGRNIRAGDRFKAVISEELARRNRISVGDTFIIETKEGYVMPGDTPARTWGEPMELQVAGLFHMNFLQPSSEYTFENGYFENNIYVDLDTYKQHMKNIDENWDVDLPKTGYPEVTFFVDESGNLDGIMQKVKEEQEVDGMRLFADNTAYQASAKPYGQIRTFAALLFAIGVLGAAAILFLFMRLWVRGRWQEIGILLSIGVRKRKIMGQMLLECMLVSVLAVFLTVLLSGTLAGISSQAAERFTAQGTNGERYRLTMELGLYPEVELNSVDKAVLSDEVTPKMVILVILLVNGISAGGILLASIQILEMEPKRLLQSM